MNYPHDGMNRRDLDRVLRDLGGSVVPIKRTGEIQYRHPLMQNRPRANGRRKDAPRHLVAFVLEIIRIREAYPTLGIGSWQSAPSTIDEARPPGVCRVTR